MQQIFSVVFFIKKIISFFNKSLEFTFEMWYYILAFNKKRKFIEA